MKEDASIKKYEFKKIIFIPVTLIILLGIIYVGFGEGILKLEGYHIVMFKTETITCDTSHDKSATCEVKLFNGSSAFIKNGEKLKINEFNMTKVNLINYGSLFLLIIGLLINHYFFNKGYDFKKKVKDLKDEVNKIG